MKKLSALLLILTLVFSLTACMGVASNTNNDETSETIYNDGADNADDADDNDSDSLSSDALDFEAEKTEAFYRSYIGEEAEVLFEKAPRGRAMHGFTRNYIRVELPAQQADPQLDNQLVKVRLGELTADKQALRVKLI